MKRFNIFNPAFLCGIMLVYTGVFLTVYLIISMFKGEMEALLLLPGALFITIMGSKFITLSAKDI